MRQARDSTFGRRLGIVAIVASVLACPCTFARAPKHPACETRAVRTQEFIPAAGLASWEPLDDHTLLVWTLHDSRAHLVELSHPIPQLLDAPIVYLVTRDHDPTVCACGHDEVVVPDGRTARIVSIRYLSERRTAELDPDGATASRVRATST